MKNYEVTKYLANGEVRRYGVLPEADVKAILKGYKYDADLEMWFSPKANIGYDVKDV